MIDAPLIEPRSALAHRLPIGAADSVRMAELRLWTLSILRGEADVLAGAVGDILTAELPREACTATRSEDHAVLWLGPDEWMLVSGPGDEAQRGLGERLDGAHHQHVDVSDHYTLVELQGARARDLLAKLVPLDMHPRAFRPGEVKGTVLGAANTHLWCVAEDRFCLTLRRSYADYGWCLLARAGREWGLPEERPVGGERLTIPG